MDEVKELHKGIQEVLVAIGKIEIEIKHLSGMATRLEETQKSVIQLEQSAKSAHKRLDGLQSQVDALEKKLEDDKKTAKDDKRWLLGFLVGAAALVWKVLETLAHK